MKLIFAVLDESFTMSLRPTRCYKREVFYIDILFKRSCPETTNGISYARILLVRGSSEKYLFQLTGLLTGCGCTWSWRFQWNFALLQQNRAAI